MLTEPGTVLIRTCSKQDLDRLNQMLILSWNVAYDGLIPQETIDRSLLAIEKHGLVEQLGVPILLAFVNDDIVGMVSASPTFFGKNAVIDMCYVHPSYQGRGIGTILLNEMYQRFERVTVFELQVIGTNASAIGFYKSNGYKIAYRWFHLSAWTPTFVMKLT